MGKFENFTLYKEELKDRENARKMDDKYIKKPKKMIAKSIYAKNINENLISEVEKNFSEMNESFSHDILIEIIKNLSNTNEANRIISIFYKANESKNADGIELGQIPQFNRLVEDAVSMILKECEGREGKDTQRREKLLVNCYAKIVGKEGTTNKVIEQLSISDIDSIIRKMGNEEQGLDYNSIMKIAEIINRKSAFIIDDEEKEQLMELTEKSIITKVKENPEIVENSQIFKVFEMLLKHYRKNENSENKEKISNIVSVANRVKDELGKKLGEDSEEYKLACEELFMLNAEESKLKTMSFDGLKELIKAELIKKMDEAELHECEGDISAELLRKLSFDGKVEANSKVMPPYLKLDKLSEAVGQVSKEYPEKNVQIGTVMCETENLSFDDFYIIQILGAHCYVLEKFDTKENTALYVVDSNEINEVFQLIREQRSIIKAHPLVTPVNHTYDDGCVTRIKKAIVGSMQKDNLEGLWEKAYSLEERIDELKAGLGAPETTEGVEGRQEEFAYLQELEKQYEKILKQVEKQNKTVEKQEEERALKAKKYIEKGGKQIEGEHNL